jgi:hypothetical protein
MPFEAQELVERACLGAGHDDFGPGPWLDGLEVLCRALAREAKLSPLGWQISELRFAALLRERLEIERWYRLRPEIGAQRIEPPVMVMGLPRTGSTVLGYMLGLDPAARSLRLWESVHPTPPPDAPTQERDPRIAAQEAALEGTRRLAPQMAAMHEETATSPNESYDLLGLSFRTQHFAGMVDVPGYLEWWLDCDMNAAYQDHARVLRLLQWRCPPYRWNLRNPPDVFCLDAVNEVYPGARFLWTHRDPARVLPSVCSLVATAWSMASDAVDRRAMGPPHLATWSLGIRRALEFRERLGSERFADVHQRDLETDPVRAIGTAYEKLGLPFRGEYQRRIRHWQAHNRRGRHGAHAYTPEEFGLDARRIRAAFAGYIERFRVPIESD